MPHSTSASEGLILLQFPFLRSFAQNVLPWPSDTEKDQRTKSPEATKCPTQFQLVGEVSKHESVGIPTPLTPRISYSHVMQCSETGT